MVRIASRPRNNMLHILDSLSLHPQKRNRDPMLTPNASLLDRCLELSKTPHRPALSGSWKLRFCSVALGATCFFAFSSYSLAHGGGNGGNMSGQGSHGNQSMPGGHYLDPFGSPWRPYGGTYDTVYSYTPTQEQAATAKKQVQDYLAAVQKGRRRAAAHRYIAVETLRPTKTQLADYLKKRAANRTAASQPSVDPGQLRCMMVFDTQSKRFVGSGCYVTESLPSVGTVAKFDTFSAEYVGTTAL
jgi:hypothetical protein